MSKDAGNSKRTAPGTPFKPGKSGNPSGRPKKREDLTARCVRVVDEVVLDAWETEVRGMGPDWVECSKLLAAYGYGKPTQKVEVSGQLTLEQLILASIAPLESNNAAAPAPLPEGGA